MPKLKSAIEKLEEKGIFGTPVELPHDWYEKAMAKRQAEVDAEQKAEADRIKKIKCPSCKSTSKDHIEKRNDNGIYGPGYSSWIVDEYYVCKKCGTMFKDMEKYKNGKIPRR
jgi:hypothetical protein